MFDVLNARNPFDQGLKDPVTPETLQRLKRFCDESVNFVHSLTTTNGANTVHTRKEYGFLAFIFRLKSSIGTAEKMFSKSDGK